MKWAILFLTLLLLCGTTYAQQTYTIQPGQTFIFQQPPVQVIQPVPTQDQLTDYLMWQAKMRAWYHATYETRGLFGCRAGVLFARPVRRYDAMQRQMMLYQLSQQTVVR